MALEHWDEVRKRWILYRSREDHSLDCQRYPFEAVPVRVFLDTSVVNIIVKYADAIFDMQSVDPSLAFTRARDVEALIHLFAVGVRANWTLVASAGVLEEVLRTPDDDVRKGLVEFVAGLIERGTAESAQGRDLGRRLADATVLAALPDRSDRELLGNAVGLGCDAFVTADIRTITSRRHRLPRLPLRILTPVEWWTHVKPWGGLWL